MLITPEYGPRVRLRAILLAEDVPSTGPREFDPCAYCEAPCIKACPQQAFDKQLYTREEMQQHNLPGRIGNYSRKNCNNQMIEDDNAVKEKIVSTISKEPIKIIKYCRNCELSCPVGK